MDKKELLRRWTLGYVEPSLFYLPQKDSDEYYNITLHMMVDYFDTVDEKILTDMTIKDMYEKYKQNTSDSSYIKYGSIGQECYTESVFFVAYDEKGNIADCSLWRDAMSLAEITTVEEKNGYTLETYSITKIPELTSWFLKTVKNIIDENALDSVFEDNDFHYGGRYLYILTSGDIYIFEVDRYDSETKKLIYKKIKIGQYDYKTDKFRIENENFYYNYMIVGRPDYAWYNYQGLPNNFNYYSSNSWYSNVAVPTLRLKKGTYTIKQVVASTGCELMEPFTITVNEDKEIYYKTTINGVILRSELIDCGDSYHKLYDRGDPLSQEKWYINGSTSQGSWEIINYTYRLSDHALLVRQKCTTSPGNNIMGFPETSNPERLSYYSGKIVRYYTTVGEYNKVHENPLPYDDDTIIADSYGYPFFSKRALNEKEMEQMGIVLRNRGTDVSFGTTYFYDKIYMEFHLRNIEYNKPSYNTPYADYQNRPTADEIAMTINKKTLLEWYEEYSKEGEGREFIKDDGYSKWYIIYYGGFSTLYDYHNLRFPHKLLSEVSTQNWSSQVNVVLSYYKSSNVDIENLSKYMTINIHCYDYCKDYIQYKNYHTILSSEVKQDADWNEEKFNDFQNKSLKKLYEKQLK